MKFCQIRLQLFCEGSVKCMKYSWGGVHKNVETPGLDDNV
jgi:hypothetical protein